MHYKGHVRRQISQYHILHMSHAHAETGAQTTVRSHWCFCNPQPGLSLTWHRTGNTAGGLGLSITEKSPHCSCSTMISHCLQRKPLNRIQIVCCQTGTGSTCHGTQMVQSLPVMMMMTLRRGEWGLLHWALCLLLKGHSVLVLVQSCLRKVWLSCMSLFSLSCFPHIRRNHIEHD